MSQGILKRLLLAVVRAWFTATFVGCVAIAGLLGRLIHLLPLLSKKRRQQLSAQIAGLCFRIIFALNPQISIEHVSEDEPAWDDLFSDPNTSPIVLINHTSPLDSIFYSACVPSKHIQHLKTLAKSSLFNLPLFGMIMNACGHFPVFFAKESTPGNFSVDKKAQEKVAKDIDEHLLEGGGLSMFPEGQLNHNDCRSLQTFRRGALQLARDRKMAIWGFLHTGVEQVWSVHETLGGAPGRIRFKLFKLDLPDAVRSSEDLNHFVQHVERLMQLELDIMHAVDDRDLSAVAQRKQLLEEEVLLAAHGDAELADRLAAAVDMK